MWHFLIAVDRCRARRGTRDGTRAEALVGHLVHTGVAWAPETRATRSAAASPSTRRTGEPARASPTRRAAQSAAEGAWGRDAKSTGKWLATLPPLQLALLAPPWRARIRDVITLRSRRLILYISMPLCGCVLAHSMHVTCDMHNNNNNNNNMQQHKQRQL